VRHAALKASGEVPGMIVQPGKLPRQAFEMLRPNVLEARQYTSLSTGTTYSVLLVHCGDVNDMGAHYPPQCYPGSGMRVTTSSPMPLAFPDGELKGVEYRLEPSRLDERSPIYLWNCMFLPGGTTTHEPSDLRLRGRTANLRYYGAGQIQVLVSATLSPEQRLAIYREALSIYESPIRVMLTDPRGGTQTKARVGDHE
jgi:hypothetical protein